MKDNTITILFAALCFNSMSTELLSMDFSDYTKRILHQNKINHSLDRLNNKLHKQQLMHIQKAIRCVGYDRDALDNSPDMAKSLEIGMDIQVLRISRNALRNLLARGNTIDNATETIRNYIDEQCETEKLAIQTLSNTFSINTPFSDKNR
jgi:hypothetical protein